MSLRRLSIVRLTVIIFISMASVLKALTLISSAPAGELNLLKKGGILDQLYGLDNLKRIDDNFDQDWMSLDGQIGATARARFAAFNFTFGYYDDGGFHSIFTPNGSQFSLSGSGVFTTTLPTFQWTLDPSGAPIWSSRLSDNSDLEDHMVTFLITAGTSAGNYVLAWEDLPSLGDKDYNDLVVEIYGAAPAITPEPSTFLLLGMGIIGIIPFLRRGH